jgi:hypothetical protein
MSFMHLFLFVLVFLGVSAVYGRRHALMQIIEDSDGFVGIEFTIPPEVLYPVVLVVRAPISFEVHGSFVVPTGPAYRTFHRLAILGQQEVISELDESGRMYTATIELPRIVPGQYVIGLETGSPRVRGCLTTKVLN